jgi:CheY-like chemotaxis protein
MVDFKTALRTTLLIVDDDVQQLELRALVLRMSAFTVLTATSPVEAMSIMTQHPAGNVGVAMLDYNMPVMNGCVLADYLRARYPELKIMLTSACLDIPQREMSSVDVFVAKGDGVAHLLQEVSTLAQASAIRESTPEAWLDCAHESL